MKTLGIVCIAALLASSCRKSDAPPASEGVPPPAVETAPPDKMPVRVQASVPKGKDVLVENQRTRPNPRPPDVKHQPASAAYPVAQTVPGKAGFVFSPYSNKIVDVRDIPAGTLVMDPTITKEETDKPYFRAP